MFRLIENVLINLVFGLGFYVIYLGNCLLSFDVNMLMLNGFYNVLILLNILGLSIYFVWLLKILEYLLVIVFLELGIWDVDS